MGKIIPKVIRAHANRLFLDNKNPRLPESVSKKNHEEEIWKHMKRAYNLDELALSITNNGYFEAEPLVVIPKGKEFSDEQHAEYKSYCKNANSQFVVVEGNRRLATMQGLLKGELLDEKREPYQISDDVRKQFEDLPVLLYPNRKSVLSFLGVHHLAGVRKWDVYERARYIVHLKRDQGYDMQTIQNTIGDRKNSAKKTYVCYRLIEMLQECDESFNVQDAKNNFSFIQLATGQGAIREYLGLPAWDSIEDTGNPIPKNKLDNLKNLFLCLFDSNYGKSLIRESRDITSRLSRILGDEDATKHLLNDGKIEHAFEMVGGTANFFNSLAEKSKGNLETISGKLTTFKFIKSNQNLHGKEELTKTIEDIELHAKEIKQKMEKK